MAGDINSLNLLVFSSFFARDNNVSDLQISSWCSFDPDSAQEDHICFSVEEKINATMCNRPTAKTGLQKEGRKSV